MGLKNLKTGLQLNSGSNPRRLSWLFLYVGYAYSFLSPEIWLSYVTSLIRLEIWHYFKD